MEHTSNHEIRFEKGLPGFPELVRFSWEQSDLELPFAVLQSLEEEHVSFLLGDPFVFFSDYEFDLPPDTEKELRIESIQDVAVWAIVTIRGALSDSTMNLKAPLVINKKSMSGRQIILNDPRYSLREPLPVNSEQGGSTDACTRP